MAPAFDFFDALIAGSALLLAGILIVVAARRGKSLVCARCGYEPGDGVKACPECGRSRYRSARTRALRRAGLPVVAILIVAFAAMLARKERWVQFGPRTILAVVLDIAERVDPLDGPLIGSPETRWQRLRAAHRFSQVKWLGKPQSRRDLVLDHLLSLGPDSWPAYPWIEIELVTPDWRPDPADVRLLTVLENSGLCDTRRVRGLLVRVVTDEPRFRGHALELLCKHGFSKSDRNSLFNDKLAAAEPAVRVEVLSVLCKSGLPKEELDARLREFLLDPDPVIRQGTCDLIWRLGEGTPECQAILRRLATDDTDEIVQMAARTAWAKLRE